MKNSTKIWTVVVSFTALLLVCPVGVQAQRLYGGYDLEYFTYPPPERSDVMISYPLRMWLGEYEYCMRAAARDEYETEAEHEVRKAEVAQTCSAYWPLQGAVAHLEGDLLSYDADRELFTFEIDLGPIRRPTQRPGFASKRDEEVWDELNIQRYRNGKNYTNDTCWVSELSPGSTGQTNENYFDGDLTVNVYQESRSFGNDKLFDICWSGGSEQRIVVQAKASIEKARSLRAIEDRLRLELTGDSSRLRRVSGPNDRTFWIYHITRISLIDSENSTVLFRTASANRQRE